MRDRARHLLVACSVLGIDADCNKAAWWNDAGVDPVKVARKLWKHTSVNEASFSPAALSTVPEQNELWNQIFRRWREGRSDNLTDLGAGDGAFGPPPPTHGRLISRRAGGS
jgi:hypothetical protein